MKLVDKYYVIMRTGSIDEFEGRGSDLAEFHKNLGTAFLNTNQEFVDDVRDAMKCANRTTALELKCEYDREKNCSYESDLKIVPLKITYEW